MPVKISDAVRGGRLELLRRFMFFFSLSTELQESDHTLSADRRRSLYFFVCARVVREERKIKVFWLSAKKGFLKPSWFISGQHTVDVESNRKHKSCIHECVHVLCANLRMHLNAFVCVFVCTSVLHIHTYLHVAAFAAASGAAEKTKVVQQRRIMSKDKIPGSMSKVQ